MKSCWVLFILLWAGICLSPSFHAQSLESLAEKKNQYISSGDYHKAAKVYVKLCKMRPDSIELISKHGSCLCQSGDLEASMNRFDEAIQRDSQNWYHYIMRAHCFDQYRYYDKAVMDFTEGLKYAPADSIKKSIYLNRAVSKNAYRDSQGALEDNLKALDINPEDLAVMNNIAMCYGDLKDYEQAEHYLKRGLAIDSTFEGLLMNLGFLYSEIERYEESLEVLNKAIDLFPDIPVTYNNRGMVKHHLGDNKGAIEDIEYSLHYFKTNSYAYRNLAIIYLDMGMEDKACENCIKAIEYGFTTNYGPEMKRFFTNSCSKK